MDFWNYGKHIADVPIANSYVPVRNTIMKKPNMLDEDHEDDELGYRYHDYDDKVTTRKRLNPLEQLSPLRGNLMSPGIKRLTDKYSNKHDYSRWKSGVKPAYFKWRRLSKIHDRSFSTVNF